MFLALGQNNEVSSLLSRLSFVQTMVHAQNETEYDLQDALV